jgi:hypothetical protein
MSSVLGLPFDGDGYLKTDVLMSIDALSSSVLVTGDGLNLRGWRADKRELLVENLRYVVSSVRSVGFAGEIGIDGSFVSAMPICRDIDAYLVVDGPDLEHFDDRIAELNQREGENLWDFSEDGLVSMPGVIGLVTPIRRKYSVDLRLDFGWFCGILGPYGERLTYRQAFRQRKQSKWPKGLILLEG